MSDLPAVRESGAVTPAMFTDALVKAVGWDKVPAEQRMLAQAICQRYDLDPMLRHVVMIEGRPFVTRDALLYIAHRSGVFDGIEVTDPVLGDTHWQCRARVYRKDMSRPIEYPGRYPKAGSNARYAPEMAIKVAETMALRRAFNVAAPVLEETFDLDEAAPPEPRRPRTLADRAASRRAEVEARVTDAPAPSPEPAGGGGTSPADHAPGPVTEAAADPGAPARCESTSPYDPPSRCAMAAGHDGLHRNRDRESWS